MPIIVNANKVYIVKNVLINKYLSRITSSTN